MPESPTAPPTELLSGRYRLQHELARGGMATVWRAHDDVLGRDVAVKLLHPHLAHDPAFLDRFRREARSAAGLNHPNVVSVFDWGEEEIGAYLVMELIEGPSLRDVLRIRGRLAPGEAVSIVAPVADALAAAHRGELIHRDVKPENILLADTGQVKVTDFGLSRAVASSNQTFGSDVIVGSPHYLAPEAVRGDALGIQADVYALGVVLFECLTGRPPFQGETPMATALQHTANTVPAPSSIVPTVPPALDDVVRRATAHDPADRYDHAHVFAAALADAVPGGPVSVDLRDGTHHTVVLPVDATDTIVRARGSVPAPGKAEVREREAPAQRRKRKRRRRLRNLLLALLVLAGAAAGAWAYLVAPVAELPELVGLTEQEARDQLAAAGFEAELLDPEHRLDVAEGRVVRHEPEEAARRGSVVGLVLSAGPRQVELPELAGRPQDEALRELTELGVQPVAAEVFSETVEQGLVVGTDPPAGRTVDEASEVTVHVSQGRQPIEVPSVVTLAADAALEQLRGLDLDPVIIDEVFSDEVPQGHIVEQNPAPGEVRFRGEQVQLKVSAGPRMFPMPDVIGEQEAEAKRILEGVGLVVEVERVSSFLRPKGEVARTDPEPDEAVHRGMTVTIFVWE